MASYVTIVKKIYFKYMGGKLVYLTKLVSYKCIYLPQYLPLLTSSCPDVAISQSASLSMNILRSSLLCQDRLLAARPEPSPIWPALCRRRVQFALTAAVLKRLLMTATSSPSWWGDGSLPCRARVLTFALAAWGWTNRYRDYKIQEITGDYTKQEKYKGKLW